MFFNRSDDPDKKAGSPRTRPIPLLPLRDIIVFPHMVVQMCAIGEESGALDHMLEKTSDHYEREVDITVARLSTLLEPFIMVVLGLLIGGLVMALYLPIFQLGQVV
jgi:type IV pilus assembly protein PilC